VLQPVSSLKFTAVDALRTVSSDLI